MMWFDTCARQYRSHLYITARNVSPINGCNNEVALYIYSSQDWNKYSCEQMCCSQWWKARFYFIYIPCHTTITLSQARDRLSLWIIYLNTIESEYHWVLAESWCFSLTLHTRDQNDSSRKRIGVWWNTVEKLHHMINVGMNFTYLGLPWQQWDCHASYML